MVLANYYESRGELEKAFDEYHALIYIVPYFDLFYEPAVKVLVEMKKYNEALEVLQELLKYQQTSFVYQWIGQIYLINHELLKELYTWKKQGKMIRGIQFSYIILGVPTSIHRNSRKGMKS